MSIRPLPDDAVHQIRSSLTITSLNDAVLGLLRNSLDAKATRVNISVEYPRGSCSVDDDGLGIPPDEFLEAGGLTKPHHTSKFPPVHNQHGSHGTFLSSLTTLSLASITSRHFEQLSHNTIIVHHANVLARNLPSHSEQTRLSSEHGTHVHIRDLFGSMPVRVKQRPLATDKATTDKLFSHLVRAAVATILAWPSDLTVCLREVGSPKQIRIKPPSGPSHADKALTYRVSRYLVQAGLADDISHGTWVPLCATTSSLSVSGCASLNPVVTKRAQFISLGIHPLLNDSGFNVLYDEINRVFSNSAFSSVEDVEDPQRTKSFPVREPKSKRGLERWPMFYFRIERLAKPSRRLPSYEDVLDRPQTIANIIDLLRLICFEFLKKHHFRPHSFVATGPKASQKDVLKANVESSPAVRRSANSASGSGKGRSRSTTPFMPPPRRPESPFDLWQRVKVGKARQFTGKEPQDASESKASLPSTPLPSHESSQGPSNSRRVEPRVETPLIDKDGRVLRKPFDDVDVLPESEIRRQPSEERDRALPATDLVTGRSETAKPVLGDSNTSPTNAQGLWATGHDTPGEELAFKLLKTTTSNGEPSEWLKQLFSEWENPVFPAVEPPAPRVEEATTNVGADARAAKKGCCTGGAIPMDLSALRLRERLSKHALANAEVISQVDRKFIMVKLLAEKRSSNDPQTLLVLIDQHAADERCRIESLLADYFIAGPEGIVRARSTSLLTPVTFELDIRECELIHRFSDFWIHWGISLDIGPSQDKRLGTVSATTLPPSILERIRGEPRLLIELLRNEVWRLEDESRAVPRGSQAARETTNWVANFQGCPQGILDMLNSRACRSAIMFNDELSEGECEDLVECLSRCSFPFQCAHGRPSMVPLVDVRGFTTVFQGNRARKPDLGESLQRYMGSQ